MKKQAAKASKAEREAAWRECMARYASSDHSVKAFCQSESVSTASFYGWQSKLRMKDARLAEGENALPGPSPFIDLGPIDAAPSIHTAALNKATPTHGRSSVEVRIDLGDGVLLTITRR